MKKMILLLLLSVCGVSLQAQSRVLAFAGSAAKDSVNRQLVAQAALIAKNLGADVTLIDLKDYPIPIYDADLETKSGMPEAARKIQQLVLNSDFLFIASPEYNSSTTPLLMNLFTWLSRKPTGGPERNVLQGKSILLLSASPGYDGGFKGLSALRTILSAIGGQIHPNQFCLPGAYQAFDAQGNLKNSHFQEALKFLVMGSLKLQEAAVDGQRS